MIFIEGTVSYEYHKKSETDKSFLYLPVFFSKENDKEVLPCAFTKQLH